MDKSLRNRFLVILGITAAAIYFAFPIEKHINLGLDLKGGMHLVLKVENEKLSGQAKEDAVLKAIEILRNRIDGLGVGETLLQRQGENEILIQLPGITDRDKAKDMIGRVAQLEFRLVNDDPQKLNDALQGKTPSGYILKEIKKEKGDNILVEETIALSGETISDAFVDLGNMGEPYISLKFNSKGTKKFGDLTQNNVNRRLAILLDGEVLSAPNINEAILGGNAQITGQFNFEEASMLALALRSGALPVPMRVEEERTIGPLLGQDSIKAGIKATIYGCSFVFIFMAIYYLKAGIIANIALLLNLLLIVGGMGFLNAMLPQSPITLTLPGIAGIILTLGMAVDANVLINERIREEISSGRPLHTAVNNGYSRALSAIVDSNVTTLIAAFMLFQFGSGPIKGFAVTLGLGLVVSLFTAIFVTRTIFNLLLKAGSLKSLPMLSFFSHTKINFVSKMYFCIVLSLVVIFAGVYAFIQKKDTIYGIDFVGGQIQEYKFSKPLSSDELRNVLNKIGIEDAVIQEFDQYPGHMMIRTSEETFDQVSQALKESLKDNPFEVLRVEKVGPVVGKRLRMSAIYAMVLALLGILVYVGFRFKHFDFAAAGVIALLHDVFVAFGVLIMLNRQIDLLVVTALLTIAGYSINDTIVIYDRIRENMIKMNKSNLAEIINVSVNQTLGRTILTTSVTFLVVLSLYIWGGEVLNTFALCLIIGFISGTYSTVFIASPLVLAWQKKK